VIYNWGGGYAGYNNDSESITKLNYVGNYLIPGADSENNGIAYRTGSPYNTSYFAGNYYNGSQPADHWELVKYNDSWNEEIIRGYKKTEPFETGPITKKDAVTAYNQVLDSGGATLPKRDVVDERVVKDIRIKTGKIIASQEEVGGWPELKSTTAPVDTDQDGMPDAWEKQHGLDPSNGMDRNKLGEDGFTMLETYLNNIK
jgi:pectate lyase